MFWRARPWNTYSLPVRLAGSPVHSSFAPRIPKSIPALWRSRAVAIVTLRFRSSKDPAHPTHIRYSAVTPGSPRRLTSKSRASVQSPLVFWSMPYTFDEFSIDT